MIRQNIKTILFAALIPAFVACGQTTASDATTTAANDTTSSTATSGDLDSAASAAGALFSGGTQSSLSVPQQALVRFVEEAQEEAWDSPYENDENYTCASIDTDDQPDNVTTLGYGDPGEYGSENQSITVAEEDFCFLPDGTANTGTGPDGEGRLGAFELIGDVNFSCSGDDEPGEVIMQSGSFGVWRNTGDYLPQIYGTFSFLVDGEEYDVNCTIFLNEDEEMEYADCTDENGDTVAQESDTSCQYVP